MESEVRGLSGAVTNEDQLEGESRWSDKGTHIAHFGSGPVQNNPQLSTGGQKAQVAGFAQEPSFRGHQEPAREEGLTLKGGSPGWTPSTVKLSKSGEKGTPPHGGTVQGSRDGAERDMSTLHFDRTAGSTKEGTIPQGMGPMPDTTLGLTQRRGSREEKEKCGQEKESMMQELSLLVQKAVRSSSWWESRGTDITIIALGFVSVPAGFLLLASNHVLPFLLGLIILGIAHTVITVKGSHLASHGALTESKRWSKFWTIFFIELCGAFTAEKAAYTHVKIHHAYTNIIGLGDSSTWKLPFLNRYVYMFIAPLAVPIITPLVAFGLLWDMSLKIALRTVCLISLGLWTHYWLLINISGFQSLESALLCMFLSRTLFAIPYIHVNIFQHIGLAMFLPDQKPKRIQQMTYGVLNLPRNPLLDWSFGHSLINCHVEHHLFPNLSDQLCLKVKPIVSQYLTRQRLPYNEDTYLSRLKIFIQCYEELMVHAPPITDLVGIQ